MFTKPLDGWREVSIRETKTNTNWAIEMARRLEGRYADRDRLIVVCDNLNTHTNDSLYEAFEPERAFALAERVDFHYLRTLPYLNAEN